MFVHSAGSHVVYADHAETDCQRSQRGKLCVLFSAAMASFWCQIIWFSRAAWLTPVLSMDSVFCRLQDSNARDHDEILDGMTREGAFNVL